MFLTFCNKHKTCITTLPFSNALTYLVNFLYYKTLLENSHSDKSSLYDQLVSLIEKKQAKFKPEVGKIKHLMHRVSIKELWGEAKQLRVL